MLAKHNSRKNKTEESTTWSEWAWDKDRNQWGRYRGFRGEYEHDWRGPDWSGWVWHTGRRQYWRSRIVQGTEEIEWQYLEASASSTSKPKEMKDKGKGEKGQLSVAFYRPRWGNLRHWALYLDTENYVYEVTGEAMHFTAEAKSGVIPNSSGSWIESISVAEIHPDDMAELHRIITETPVQNDVQG